MTKCAGYKIIENQALIAKTMRVDKPGDVPREVELTMYTCLECGGTFNEMEGRGEDRRRTTTTKLFFFGEGSYLIDQLNSIQLDSKL